MRAMGFAGDVIAAMGRSYEGGDGCVGARHARDVVRGRRDRGHGPLLRQGDRQSRYARVRVLRCRRSASRRNGAISIMTCTMPSRMEARSSLSPRAAA